MIDRDFGNWLAGFIDGEGCFYITRDNARAVYRPRFSLALRHDDSEVVHACHKRTGLGSVHYYRGQSGHQVVRWVIQSRADCLKLAALLNDYPLRAKKRRDFAVWQRAVHAANSIRPGRANNDEVRATLAALKEELKEVRSVGLYN